VEPVPLLETGEDNDRALTIPNAITAVRLACVPVLVVLLLIHHPRLRYQAAGLMAVLGCTDWVDGYLARHLHQVSSLGKILDPVADRLLLIVGIGAILYDGDVPAWVAVIALVREGLVAAATLALAALGARRIDVTWYGKAGTFGLMVAFPLFLTSHSTANWRHSAGQLAWVAAIPGLVFGLYALVLYAPLARRALRQGRSDRDTRVKA
jgi:cardiolipin synthase (CMP-forming)